MRSSAGVSGAPIGAALMLGAVLTGVAAVTLTLSDDVAHVIAELPAGARRLGAALGTKGEPSTLDSLDFQPVADFLSE